MSLRLCVRLSPVYMAKHILKLFRYRVATPFQFFDTKRHGDIPTGPLTGCRMEGGMKKSRFSMNISLYLRNYTKHCRGNLTRAFERYHFNDLERSIPHNIPETVRDTDIVSIVVSSCLLSCCCFFLFCIFLNFKLVFAIIRRIKLNIGA